MQTPRLDDLSWADEHALLGEMLFQERKSETVLVFTGDPPALYQRLIKYAPKDTLDSYSAPSGLMPIVRLDNGQTTAFVGPGNDRAGWRHGDYVGLVPPTISSRALRIVAASCLKLLRYHPLSDLLPFVDFDPVTFVEPVSPEVRASILEDGYCLRCMTNYRLWHGGHTLGSNSFEVVCEGCGAHPAKVVPHEPLTVRDWALYQRMYVMAERGHCLERFPIYSRPREPESEE